MKTVEIFLPDEETFRTMLETAFDKFMKQAAEAGHKSDERTRSFIKDIFVSGYCYGYNDTKDIIYDQLTVYESIKVRKESHKNIKH